MLIQNNVDVLTVAETKLDDSFPIDQFLLNGFKRPYRLDVSCNSGGLLTYVNSDIATITKTIIQNTAGCSNYSY